MPGPVADRADQWLDDQAGDRPGEIEDRELIGPHIYLNRMAGRPDLGDPGRTCLEGRRP
jgi:hypothetical protein